jgi:hypothetical protein
LGSWLILKNGHNLAAFQYDTRCILGSLSIGAQT